MKVYCHSKYNYLVPFFAVFHTAPLSIYWLPPYSTWSSFKKHTWGKFPPKTVDPVEALLAAFCPTHWTVSLGVGMAAYMCLTLILR